MTSTPYPAEHIEAEWFFDWLDGTPEPARDVLAATAIRLAGGGIATSMANDPVQYWSKALGFQRPIDRGAIAEIVDFYRAARTPSATIQIAPDLLPDDWDEICATFGLTPGSSWVKLSGSSAAASDSPLAATSLRVGAVADGDLEEWADVVFRGFGMPPEHLASLAVASARRGAIEPFAAWIDDRLVAGASLAIVDGVAALLGAATLPEFRGLGAQSALIAVRSQAAREAGIDELIAETGRPSVDGANASLNNMVRAGLVPIYDRVNWEWENPDLA